MAVKKAARKTATAAPVSAQASPAAAAVSRPQASASVQRLVIDEGSVDQRLDNFLIKVLKGAPKTLVYRIIRSGEVRVNKGRASADTRLALGDEVRVPPLRLTEKPTDEASAVPARSPHRQARVCCGLRRHEQTKKSPVARTGLISRRSRLERVADFSFAARTAGSPG